MTKQNPPYKLEIKSLNNGKWRDMDVVLLHACFQCLVNFIENESYESTRTEDREVIDELERLYKWWKDRPNRESPVNGIPSDYMQFQNGVVVWQDEKYPYVKKLFNKQYELDAIYEREDTANLVSLIRLRGYMWT